MKTRFFHIHLKNEKGNCISNAGVIESEDDPTKHELYLKIYDRAIELSGEPGEFACTSFFMEDN